MDSYIFSCFSELLEETYKVFLVCDDCYCQAMEFSCKHVIFMLGVGRSQFIVYWSDLEVTFSLGM
jgi:hypothetical protein